MYLSGKRLHFRQNRAQSNPYRVLVLLMLLMISLFLLRSLEQGQIQSPFAPTPIPTRIASSFALEGQSHFTAGNLEKSIEAYQKALELDPENALLLAELARIQLYSSRMLTTDAEVRVRRQEALKNVERAAEIAPEESTVHAIRAFALDWNSNPIVVGNQSQAYLTDAEQAAARALQLDNQNTLALAYYAEILVDQTRFLQAEQIIRQAVERDPNQTLMDVYRVSGYVQESLGYYGTAIEEYKKALKITPNLTFLHIAIGVNYRQLKQYELALEYFDEAAKINDQLGNMDPLPYIAIGKTYSQMGEFFIAGRNVLKALQFTPTNPEVYGTLGMVYFKSRNYESAIEALQCAVRGCPPEISCAARSCNSATDTEITIEGMPLSPSTVVYYYTYGSALAGMHRPSDPKCEEAMKVLGEVRAGFPEDTTILQIISESEAICTSFGYRR